MMCIKMLISRIKVMGSRISTWSDDDDVYKMMISRISTWSGDDVYKGDG